MSNFKCPYCGQEKDSGSPASFTGCKFCGYKSALVDSRDQKLLIVDREMPYLERRCQELSDQMPGIRVIVDRRINQELLSKDRRDISPSELSNRLG